MKARYFRLSLLTNANLISRSRTAFGSEVSHNNALRICTSDHGSSVIESSSPTIWRGYHVRQTSGHLESNKSSARRCISEWSWIPLLRFIWLLIIRIASSTLNISSTCRTCISPAIRGLSSGAEEGSSEITLGFIFEPIGAGFLSAEVSNNAAERATTRRRNPCGVERILRIVSAAFSAADFTASLEDALTFPHA